MYLISVTARDATTGRRTTLAHYWAANEVAAVRRADEDAHFWGDAARWSAYTARIVEWPAGTHYSLLCPLGAPRRF
jgi:hypothetical protein